MFDDYIKDDQPSSTLWDKVKGILLFLLEMVAGIFDD